MAFHKLWDNKFEIAPGKWVFVQSQESKERATEIISKLKRKWSPPGFFYHLQSGGHVAALKAHANNKYFCCIDIQDFFTSINLSRVTRSLKKFFNYNLARELARDSVIRINRDGVEQYILPFGFKQSPIIASLCLQESALGNALHILNGNADLIVSVYVDDIIISSNDLQSLETTYHSLTSAATKSGWTLNQVKSFSPASKISVFNIEIAQSVLSISPDRLLIFSKSFNEATSSLQKDAIVRYIESINPNQIAAL